MTKYKSTKTSLGENLRKIRRQKGMMQIDVAVATRLNRTYVSRIETGKARVRLNVLYRLVKGLKIKSTDLMEDYSLAFAKAVVYDQLYTEGGEKL